MVIHVLICAEDEVHLAVVHFYPLDVAVSVVVGADGFYLGKKVLPDAWNYGEVGRCTEIVAHAGDVVGVSLVIPFGLERAVPSPADKGVRAVLQRVVPAEEFLFSHILRIEAESCRPVAQSLDEGLAVEP